MPTRRSFLSLVTAAAAWHGLVARAQERFSPFVGSNPENVRRMVELAAPRSGETVIDLGSGDGRIVFAATEGRPGVRGLGVDINAELIQKANAAAKAQGLADRVRFMHQNAFDADLSKVDVIFMWLFPELMRLLRPKILAQARPTRVVAATWDLGSWQPDAVDDQGGRAACDPQMDRACAHRRRLGLGSRPRRAPTAFQRAFRAAHAAGRRCASATGARSCRTSSCAAKRFNSACA